MKGNCGLCIVKDEYNSASGIRSFQGTREEIIQFSGGLFKTFMLLGVCELTNY